MLAEAQAALPKQDQTDEPTAPPMVTFSAEVENLQGVINELRILRALFIQSKSKEGTPTVQPQLLSGPRTALQRAMVAAKYAQRKAKHEALVARVLPHKRKASDDQVG